MASLHCMSFNCRGWNSALITLKSLVDSFDVCFVQEHWLTSGHLYKLNDMSSDFLSVGVSGMDDTVLLSGRPYGGCSILYRKWLSSSIIPNSNRFCAVRLQELSGSSVLLVYVYLPSEGAMFCFNDYLNILGELEGFIESQLCDHTLVVGDFNVDFNCGCSLASLLTDFIVKHDFVVSDLSYLESVKFTYERDDGLVKLD